MRTRSSLGVIATHKKRLYFLLCTGSCGLETAAVVEIGKRRTSKNLDRDFEAVASVRFGILQDTDLRLVFFELENTLSEGRALNNHIRKYV